MKRTDNLFFPTLDRSQRPHDELLPQLLRERNLPVLRHAVRARVLGRSVPERAVEQAGRLELLVRMPGQRLGGVRRESDDHVVQPHWQGDCGFWIQE